MYHYQNQAQWAQTTKPQRTSSNELKYKIPNNPNKQSRKTVMKHAVLCNVQTPTISWFAPTRHTFPTELRPSQEQCIQNKKLLEKSQKMKIQEIPNLIKSYHPPSPQS